MKPKNRCVFSKYISGSVTRISNTTIYKSLDYMNVKSARFITRNLGYRGWSSEKRRTLLSVIVLDISARMIQSIFKKWMVTTTQICPITLTKMSKIHPMNRYFHTNTWFDIRELIDFMRVTCDFIHPVTRVEFTKEDINEIDPSLLVLFNSRKMIRSSMASDLQNIQSIENEMEDFFLEIIETAYTTEHFKEFRLIFRHWRDKISECFSDLMYIDPDRCRLALKSLYDLIPNGPYLHVYMSRNRKILIQHMIDHYIEESFHEQEQDDEEEGLIDVENNSIDISTYRV